ncbi:MAG: class I SAM-dependent methyltransferase [Halieaceae bacterium]|nr:class I SAM-dependent methyltransferase [Halieaceae bacterium]
MVHFARSLDLELFASEADLAPRIDSDDLVLDARGGLSLRFLDGRAGPVRLSFNDPALRHRRHARHNELLGRAMGWRADRPPSVLDATAGFGRDAFTLADLGCAVLMCERQPVMAALLQRALEEAQTGDERLRDIATRLELEALDARSIARDRLAGIDVIYLDPMFSPSRKALPSKDMQLLQVLAQEDGAGVEDQVGLLAWAREQPVRRVVVKRPRRAEALGSATPSHRLTGRSVRFDVYVNAAHSGAFDEEAKMRCDENAEAASRRGQKS